MEGRHRLGLILAALVVALIAFFALSPGNEDDAPPPRGESQGTRPEEPTATVRGPRPKPRFETIRIARGQVVGGKRKITVSKGDTARIEIKSDAPDEIHLHGYDLYRDVAARKPARFRIKADIEGVFEIEAHDLGHVVIGTLVVEP